MTWRAEDPQGNESAKIRWSLVPYTVGTGLDLGCGPWKAFPHFIGVDNGHHFGTAGADIAVDTCEKLPLFATDSMDFVFSSHLLEHIADWKGALSEWFRVIKPGGYLCLYVPDEDEYPKVGEPGANPDHKWNVNFDLIIEGMKACGNWDLVEYEKRNQGREYSLWFVFQKGGDGQRLSYAAPKPAKTAAVVRYGAFGDAVQTASIIAGLKAQDYHVTVYTTDVGHMILKHDPHVDKFIIQGKDQIPNPLLGEFWDYTAKKYDKFVNLSESVEASLLVMPGRMPHNWPDSMRRKYFDANYLEYMHDIAELPYVPAQRFYPSPEEAKWAQDQRKQIGGQVILWSLAGSAVHKTWPHLDTILARLMVTLPDVKVVLVGDHLCQLLEQGWEKEPRVLCRSGIWTIRESLAFAQVADVVIGSETGVLNAVGFDEVQKIVFLSHSSVNNLTRDWKNTIALTPENTPCYPCHKMHYNWDHCHQDEATGTAKCQADISPDLMWIAVNQALKRAS